MRRRLRHRWNILENFQGYSKDICGLRHHRANLGKSLKTSEIKTRDNLLLQCCCLFRWDSFNVTITKLISLSFIFFQNANQIQIAQIILSVMNTVLVQSRVLQQPLPLPLPPQQQQLQTQTARTIGQQRNVKK